MILTSDELYAFYQETIALLTPIYLPSRPVDPVRASAKLKLLKTQVEGLTSGDLTGADDVVKTALLDATLVGRLSGAIAWLDS